VKHPVISVLYIGTCLLLPVLSAQETYTDYLSAAEKGAFSSGRTATVRVPRANVRYGPDAKNYPIVVTLSKGDTVTVYGKKGDWYEIGFPPGGKAWIFGEYVDILGNEGTVTADDVLVRADARMGALAIGKVDKGTRVKLLSRKGKWLRIAPLPSLRAYIYAPLVEMAGAGKEVSGEDAFFAVRDLTRFLPDWGSSPEGKQLKTLDEQVWAYKASINFRKTPTDVLEKTRKALRDIQKELGKISRKTRDTGIKESASVIHRKAEKVIAYIDAIITFRRNLALVEKKTKERLEAVEKGKATRVLAGVIDDVGRFVGRPSRYVLKRGDTIICFLISKTYNLKDYYYKEVVVTGGKRVRSKGPYPVVLVTKMTVKGEHGWKPRR